jgi:hypothetical protein
LVAVQRAVQPPRTITKVAPAVTLTIFFIVAVVSASSSASSCPSVSSSPATLLQGSRALRKDKRDDAADACLRQSCFRCS